MRFDCVRYARPWYREQILIATARLRFASWLAAEPELPRLLATLERRAWEYDPQEAHKQRCHRQRRDPITVWTLERDELAALKAEVVRRVEAAGGQLEVGDVVITVVAGELRISMR